MEWGGVGPPEPNKEQRGWAGEPGRSRAARRNRPESCLEAGLCPRPGAIREVGLLSLGGWTSARVLPRIRQSVLLQPQVGAPSMATGLVLLPTKVALTEPQGHPPLPRSRALGSPGSLVHQEERRPSWELRHNCLYTVSPILLLLAFFNKYLVFTWQRSSTTLRI